MLELSDTSFYPDQIHRLSRARVIVGVHGAGLGNMVWMAPEQGGVIEIMHNAGGLNSHYAQMGECMDLWIIHDRNRTGGLGPDCMRICDCHDQEGQDPCV